MIHNLPYLTQKDGHLFIENVDATTLAEKYGTPLYVYSKNRILENYQRLKTAFEKAGAPIFIHYAVKCNNNLAILHLLREAGAGADVSNENEIELARYAGFKPENLIYTGNNNPNDELGYSLKYADKINLDDISVLPRLLKFGKPKILSFRINPGIGKGSYKTNVFAGKQAKFGIDPETALYAYQMGKKTGIKKFGMHMMPGSGGLDEDYFAEVVKKLFEIAEMIAEKANIKFEFINVGGGLGIPYLPTEKPLNINNVAKKVASIYKTGLKRGKIGAPRLECEPGRYIVGDSAIILSRVHCIKESFKRYAGTDAGMNTLIRPALHGSHHEILCANKMASRKTKAYTVCGRICENTDMHPGERQLSELEEGDLLATLDAGAYGYSMSFNFNTYGRPAEVMVNGSKHAPIRKRETLDDLKRNMIVQSI